MSDDWLSEGDVIAEIRRIYDTTVGEGRIAPLHWVVQSVMLAHPVADGPNRRHNEVCARAGLYHLAREALRSWDTYDDGASRDERQYILPGQKRMQLAYTTRRRGEPVLVPLQQLTRRELEAKRDEYFAISRGAAEHAREIQRYLDEHPEIPDGEDDSLAA